jgi:CHAT domain-containing protein
MRALFSVTAKSGSQRLEEGMASLLHATELAPEDPSLLSDLAALYLLDAQRNHRPLSLVLGLETALQATARPNAPPEAFYNRALLLESLLWTEAAEAAWKEVIRREPQVYWVEEARLRLTALHRLREQSPQNARKLLELRDRAWRELLPSLAGLDVRMAKAALETLAAIAGTLAERSGDTLLREAVSRLQKAFESRNRAAWHDLVRGHALFESGYKTYQRGELSRARQNLTTAARLFKRRGSPFQFWSRFYIACALQQEERYGASLKVIRHLGRAVGHHHPYWSLLGYLAWMEGQNRMFLGRPLEAINHFRESLAAFAHNGEQDNQAAVHALLADCLLELGRQEDAWQELYQGLRLGQRLVQPRRAVLVFNIAADANLQYLRPRVARLFQDRAIAASAALGNPKLSYLSLVDRGLAAAAATDLKSARDDLQAARTLIATISDDSSRRRARADIATLEAAVDSDSRRAARITRLTEALALYRQLHFQTAMTITAYEERSRLLAAEGNLENAATDLVTALQLYEHRLLAHANDQTRWSLHSDAQRTYDRLIALYLEMGDPKRAFSAAERSRQFSLYSDDFHSLLRRGADPDLKIEEVQHRLGDHQVLVLFKQLDSEILIWIIRQDRMRFLRRPCDAGDLRRAVSDFVSRLRAGAPEDEIHAASHTLFASLFADVLREAGPEDLLVLVPDRELFDLPAAAVFTPQGVPLGKLRALIVVPTVEVYLRAGLTWPRTTPPSGARRALILSNPSFDTRGWSGLPRLTGAEAEGAAVSHLYSEKVYLVGAAATRNVLLHEASRADVIHFAGHAIVNPRRPDLSLLLLAPEPSESDGALYQHEIYHLKLRRSPVVILGACDSASLSGNPGEGLSSLAHAFLSAGASAVVGTLWPVEDETAARLMLDLHQGLQRGLTPERALQQAQKQYLEDERLRQHDPWGWAAFQVIGASHSPKEAPDA